MVTRDKLNRPEEYLYPVVNFGDHLQRVKNILADFERKDVVNRIWHKDYTIWKPDPTEIRDRLGWLQITDKMVEQIPSLEAFAQEVHEAGFHHVVLLGMGGSSLGPEVLRQTFGSAAGYPTLAVVDSTAPASLEAVTKSIEIRHTLFLVSSKSGTTTETLSFYRYFHCLVTQEVGEDQAGFNFVAITDADTPLARLAEQTGFRRVFTNPDDIGGRYSVLSYFGLVPAALTGLDLRLLLQKATLMQEGCAPCVNVFENAGVWLGAMIGYWALNGRDKLTFILSPSIRSLGLWIEQLIAESTGKEGKGVLPVTDEPPVASEYYGKDRLWVYLRVKGDNNTSLDKAVEVLEVSGQPVIQLEMGDQYDLGAEFFRWEMATAVAGAILGVNPFDQPDVQAAKDATKSVLKEFQMSHSLPAIESNQNLDHWLQSARPGKYLAIMAYIKSTPSTDRAFSELRRRILEKYRIAVTLGYGPRFLHSTGQLHKGGPNSGLFMQLTANRSKDLGIPGEPFSFGVLTEAEAQGDYRALQTKDRKVTRVHLSNGSGAAIERFTAELMR